MDDNENSDLDTADDFNTRKSLGDTTEVDDNMMLEDDLESQPTAVKKNPQNDENRRKTKVEGNGHGWYNILTGKLAKSTNFNGKRISDSDLKDIAVDLKDNGILKSNNQIQQSLRNFRYRYIKLSHGPPKYVKTVAERKSFNMLVAKMTNSLEEWEQKPKSKLCGTAENKRKNKPPAKAKPPSSTDSAVISRLDKMSKELLQVSNNFARFRSDVLKALPIAEPKRSDNTIKFTEGNSGEVLDQLQSFLQLKKATVKSTKTLNEYVLENFIGSGTFSVVFRAVEKKTKTSFAIKIVKSEQEAIEERDFMSRLATSGKNCNEYCCFPFDTFDLLHDGKKTYCFIMDLLRKDLFTVIFEEKMEFSLHSIVQALAQAFSALTFINSVGFIHSDVKPENIMMADYKLRKLGDKEVIIEPRVKIIDANALIPIQHAYRECQTARYRCPEVLLGTDFDESIDTWSMGVIAIEMITGDFLFDFEYDITEHAKAAPQVQMIEKVIEPLPESLWEICNFADLKNALDDNEPDATTLTEILSDFSSHGYGIVLNAVLPSLLKTDPNERPKPDIVAEQLAEFLPIP